MRNISHDKPQIALRKEGREGRGGTLPIVDSKATLAWDTSHMTSPHSLLPHFHYTLAGYK